jgi:hypothetical protein
VKVVNYSTASLIMKWRGNDFSVMLSEWLKRVADVRRDVQTRCGGSGSGGEH